MKAPILLQFLNKTALTNNKPKILLRFGNTNILEYL